MIWNEIILITALGIAQFESSPCYFIPDYMLRGDDARLTVLQPLS